MPPLKPRLNNHILEVFTQHSIIQQKSYIVNPVTPVPAITGCDKCWTSDIITFDQNNGIIYTQVQQEEKICPITPRSG